MGGSEKNVDNGADMRVVVVIAGCLKKAEKDYHVIREVEKKQNCLLLPGLQSPAYCFSLIVTRRPCLSKIPV